MKTQARRCFNLVEMALAIAVLGVGAICVISILPVGVKENKVSSGENYSAHAADSLQAYITREAVLDWNVVKNLSETKPSSGSLGSPATWGDKNESNHYSQSNTSGQWLEGDLFKPTGAVTGDYAIRMQTNVSSGNVNDFTGELLIWKKKIDKIAFGGTTYDLPNYTEQAWGINMEISWPIEVAYAKREKRNYYFEVFNPSYDPLNPTGGGTSMPSTVSISSGTVQFNGPTSANITVLGTAMEGLPVYMRVKYTEPQGHSTRTTTYYPFGSSRGRYNPVYSGGGMDISAVTSSSYTIDATTNSTFGTYYNTASNPTQIVILRNGDLPPVYEPYGTQPSVVSFLAPYINAETKRMELDDNQVIYLFELWTTDTHSPMFDMQDLVILAEFNVDTGS